MTSFFDSNVLLYLADPTTFKARVADGLVEKGGLISVQVLNEYANVAIKKLKMDMPTMLASLANLRELLDVVPLTLNIHDRAMQIATTNKIGIFDANIIAAAELSGCDVLYSEDMSNGQRIGGVTICNPFMAGT